MAERPSDWADWDGRGIETPRYATGSRAANDRQRQWVTFALLGREITALDAAARLSILQHADEYGIDAPDVRGRTFDYDVARDQLEELRRV